MTMRGLIVFIGNTGLTHRVLVAWTPHGHELELLDRVREFSQEQVMVLGTSDATHDDVEEFKAVHRNSRAHGHWFNRTPELMKAIAATRSLRHTKEPTRLAA